MLHPVAPQAFLLQEYLLKDVALVIELWAWKVPTNPTSSSAGACEKDIKRGVTYDLFVNGFDWKHGTGSTERAVAGHGARRNDSKHRQFASLR